MSEAIVLPTHPLFKNLSGRRFGRLSVLSYAGRVGRSKISAWLCRCDCGTEKIILATRLSCGVQSCGCLRMEAVVKSRRTHGMSKSAEYRIWCNMRSRCGDRSSKSYPDYGNRGIAVCQRWKDSFADFISDMGMRPSSLHELDRMDNQGNYERSNCRWVERLVNARNKRSNHRITFNGITMCISEWSEKTGLARHVIWKRLKCGWTVARTLTTPSRRHSETLRDAED